MRAMIWQQRCGSASSGEHSSGFSFQVHAPRWAESCWMLTAASLTKRRTLEFSSFSNKRQEELLYYPQHKAFSPAPVHLRHFCALLHQ